MSICRNDLGAMVGKQLARARATLWDCRISFRCPVAIYLKGRLKNVELLRHATHAVLLFLNFTVQCN